MDGATIEACSEASEVLELVEATFDAVAGLVEEASCGIVTLRDCLDGMTASMSASVMIWRKSLLW
ncbi:hypothetical protein X727_33175 [Mesorhizobium sp. L103C119B0]|uniref:hypothetical protein n=1 Tax=Mesorhizobium sp. L103C119B0 TaxID=1287085 RepID=UPI0003D02915|nr:hypothetical protein [Mesorhizobium sp. L103C119B0]ESZ55381.1 hypothetical protein X727_33175 [Mesorhizobium sp. L103C119B0]